MFLYFQATPSQRALRDVAREVARKARQGGGGKHLSNFEEHLFALVFGY
jgi:hypothetical protein